MQHNEQAFSQEKNTSPAIVTDRGLLRRKSRDIIDYLEEGND